MKKRSQISNNDCTLTDLHDQIAPSRRLLWESPHWLRGSCLGYLSVAPMVKVLNCQREGSLLFSHLVERCVYKKVQLNKLDQWGTEAADPTRAGKNGTWGECFAVGSLFFEGELKVSPQLNALSNCVLGKVQDRTVTYGWWRSNWNNLL